VWSEGDLAAMEADIAAMRAAGLAGVVLGASLPDGRLDGAALARLCTAAAGMERVLHRAFDLAPDVAQAVEVAVRLGFARILTSGGAVRAMDGRDRLALTLRLAAGRIGILPGSGITAENVAALLAAVPVAEVHASCAGEVATGAQAVAMGFAPALRRETDPGRVRAMKAALAAVQSRV
ncbi:MAG: copper homeostasis protein CutC, partial [Rhodobacterales bacterium]|nr:copper homeostasis protein CutC [Rhodobacterales bacterium]